MKTVIQIAAILIVGWVAPACAGQSARLVCVERDTAKPQDCSRIKIQVVIQNDKDVGKQGMNGVFAILDNGLVAYWTETDGWAPYGEETLLKPINPGLKTLGPVGEYEVFSGSREALCKLADGHSFNLYAWHIGLNKGQIQNIQDFMNKFEIVGWQAENFWNSTLLSKAVYRKQAGMVHSVDCSQKS